MTDKKSELSRRAFLYTSLGGIASVGALALGPRAIMAQEEGEAKSTPGGEAIYRTLGKTGMKIPIVSMGVMNANNPDIVQASYDLGIRHFDTAARYAYGRNELMVGNVLQKSGVRDKVIIATKELRPAQRTRESLQQSKAKLIKLTEASLKRLKTDYIDILYIHSVARAEDLTNPGFLEAFTELKKQGKIRAAGVTTHENMALVINEVVSQGFFDVVLTAINVAMVNNTALLEAIASASSKGIGIIAMKTQAGGSRLPEPESLSDFSSTTVATASLKWVMRNENITTAIPGFDNYQHMREDFSVARNLEYDDDEKKFLSDNRITLGMGFCHQCRKCEPTCPYNVDIPSLMRTHMYAAQYANFNEARVTLDDIAAGRGLRSCSSCTTCTALCTNHVNIPRRIENLRTIYA